MSRTFVTLCSSALLAVISLSAVAGSLERAAPDALGFSTPRLERLSALLAEYADNERFAGSVTLVARHGRIAYLEAFGHRDRASHSTMQEDTIFRIASQSKAIVSVAAMILQEEGLLLIEDPIARYLPEFSETTVAVPKDGGGYDVVPADRPIKIRDLLTHTSGYDYGQGVAADRWTAAGIHGYYFSDRDEPIAATVARMASLPASAQPGDKWVYGYSTDILGAVVERASGMPLDEFLDERIFQPLGMTDTHFYLPPNKRDRLATLYAVIEGKLERAPENGWNGQGAFVNGPRKSFSGGAGLVSTAMDYARFLQMILNGGELDGERVLGRKTIELMTVDHLVDVPFRPGQGFGLGFSVLEDVGSRGTPGSAGELGWGGAYHSTYWIDPVEQLVVVHLTQLIPSGGLDDHAKVRALVYQALDTAEPGGTCGWERLFDGRSLNGWTPKLRGHRLGENYADTFRVEDGAITVSYDGYESFGGRFGHLFYERPYSHYRLRFEYRIFGEPTKDIPVWAFRNSGVMFHSPPPETMPPEQDFPVSLEMQLLRGRGDGEPRPTANVCTPGTHVVYQGKLDETHCIQSASPTMDSDNWVKAELLVVRDQKIVHYINGEAVLQYERPIYGGDGVSGHSPALVRDGAPVTSGYISLQAEGHPIQFRNIEIMDLASPSNSQCNYESGGMKSAK